MNAWKRKALALARLAEDQAGKPEGNLAREKLLKILERHPEARDYAPIQKFMVRDLHRILDLGGSIAGSWTGNNMEDAISQMVSDYRQRLADLERRTVHVRLLPEVRHLEPWEIIGATS